MKLLFELIFLLGYFASTGISWRNSFRKSWRLHMVPITYKTIEVPIENKKRKLTILVNEKYPEVAEEIFKWEFVDNKLLEEWSRDGKAFNLKKKGIYNQIVSAEESEFRSVKKKLLGKRRSSCSNLYVNAGNDSCPVYVKASEVGSVKDLKANRISVEKLIQLGLAFTNVTKLLIEERVLHRADEIALRIRNNYPMTSPVWEAWTNKTSKYNATSLTQVFAEYFRNYSIGDTGILDENGESQYVPQRGYPGTLAPGEKFKSDRPIEELSTKILHPWPAFQEVPVHCRWPNPMPMIPPPLLWLAMNDLYCKDYKEEQLALLNKTGEEIIGGTYMEAKHAIHIAKYSKFGNSYDPAIQLKHGGMNFTKGNKLPHYFPDHGPTVPIEEAMPPIDDELKPLLDIWYDPAERDEKEINDQEKRSWQQTSFSIEQEIDREMDQRRQAVEKSSLNIPNAAVVARGLEEKRRLDEKIEKRYQEIRNEQLPLFFSSNHGKALFLEAARSQHEVLETVDFGTSTTVSVSSLSDSINDSIDTDIANEDRLAESTALNKQKDSTLSPENAVMIEKDLSADLGELEEDESDSTAEDKIGADMNGVSGSRSRPSGWFGGSALEEEETSEELEHRPIDPNDTTSEIVMVPAVQKLERELESKWREAARREVEEERDFQLREKNRLARQPQEVIKYTIEFMKVNHDKISDSKLFDFLNDNSRSSKRRRRRPFHHPFIPADSTDSAASTDASGETEHSR